MSKVTDPFAIYMQAYAFEETSRILSSIVMHKPNLLFPYMVNCAFSVELYFKCIYYIENKRLLSDHNLFGLFDKIGAMYQTNVEEEWDKHIHTNIDRILDMNRPGFPLTETSLRSTLKVSGNVFTNARYFYESQDVGDFMIGSLPRCIRTVIDRDFPSWKSKADVTARRL